ncbi:MAG: hypothetical protein U5R06_01350 [candidate division KSB1 bacterium]|nr:hypothetical protein [candidate division KSB1 bacterium]
MKLLMKRKSFFVVLLFFTIILSCADIGRKKYALDKTITPDNIKYAGARSSSYGIEPFPAPRVWETVMNSMQEHFNGSAPCGIWIVGRMHQETRCKLEFPSEGQPDTNLVFLDHNKHNAYLWMPPEYRGDLIFVSDSQIFESMDAMIQEFVEYWADYFKPNPVGFQYGYPSDRPWWRQLQNPPADIGHTIAQHHFQDCGLLWVDFTLREVFPGLD